MNTFHSLLCLMGVTSVVSERVDLVARLPLEVAYIIFRKLDERSLYNASKVDDLWMNVIKSDRVLRTRLRRYVCALTECDPLNLRRFASAGERTRSRRVKPKDGRYPGFTAATTFRIAEEGEASSFSRPLKRRRSDNDAASGMPRKIKIMRY